MGRQSRKPVPHAAGPPGPCAMGGQETARMAAPANGRKPGRRNAAGKRGRPVCAVRAGRPHQCPPVLRRRHAAGARRTEIDPQHPRRRKRHAVDGMQGIALPGQRKGHPRVRRAGRPAARPMDQLRKRQGRQPVDPQRKAHLSRCRRAPRASRSAPHRKT